ncbi:DUF4160 domain-containing protein [Priestia megaterium]|uniref:DUF4160 domain-containing protein n=1 Tax=Priestia megaterium TaxID=1404 RepID=UPI003D0957F2
MNKDLMERMEKACKELDEKLKNEELVEELAKEAIQKAFNRNEQSEDPNKFSVLLTEDGGFTQRDGFKFHIRTREHTGEKYKHFHVEFRGCTASFRIDNGHILQKNSDFPHQKIVREWSEENRDLLEKVWDETRPMVYSGKKK